MPATKKRPTKPKAPAKQTKKATPPPTRLERTKRRIDDFLSRRPHRSFRRTRRRDYVRSLKLPGYVAFTYQVHKLLWQHKKMIIGLVVIYGVVSALLMGGLLSQDTYSQLRDTVKSTSNNALTGFTGAIEQAGLVLVSSASGGTNGSSDTAQAQQVYAAIGGLLVWLTVVWLLRAVLAGKKPRLRDGLYNAGAPILPTFLVALLLLVQLIPIALAAVGYMAASSSGLLDIGFASMAFWIIAALLTIMSLYWVSGTFMALVIVTLPGMYPWQAIRTAGDLVVGRRIRILLRLLWLVGIIVVSWVIVMIPVILLDGWLKDSVHAPSWLPLVPVALLVMSTLTIVWSSAYVYLFYRKVVDDDAAPA